ncbi:MAG: cytochrome c [Betaproteobacteria bacterium]|nr:cytochrome c [Betaproteobacteria bacterium]
MDWDILSSRSMQLIFVHQAQGWHHPDHVLFAITKNSMVPPYAPKGYGSDMPAFGGKLSDREIWAVLAFLKGHWSTTEVRAARAEMTRNARPR